MKENETLMTEARESLKGKWDQAVLAYLIYFLITGAGTIVPSHPFILSLASLILGGPMAYGMVVFSLTISRNGTPKLSRIFEGFDQFGRTLSAYLLMMVFVLLWSLLLVVPGIIAAISYSQTFFILAENDSIGVDDAIEKSKQMMYGYKWKYFGLCLRFFGWGLLCILTLGIGFLWLAPYMQVSFAKFYDDLKLNARYH